MSQSTSSCVFLAIVTSSLQFSFVLDSAPAGLSQTCRVLALLRYEFDGHGLYSPGHFFLLVTDAPGILSEVCP